jgi:hypothetical protein
MVIVWLISTVANSACTFKNVGATKADSKDVIATGTPTFYMKYASTTNTAAKSADWNWANYVQGQLPYPALTLPIDSAFTITWASGVQIRSIMGDVHIGPGVLMDVYFASAAATLVRGDTRFLCLAASTANGVFNCPFTSTNKVLVFWPLAGTEAGNLVFREIRAWSGKDLASGGTVIAGTGSTAVVSGGGSIQELVGIGPTIDL